MIVSIQRNRLKANKHREFLQTWNSLVGKIREEDGCSGCCLYQETADQNALLIYSTWQSQESLNSYLLSLNHRVLKGAINLLAENSQSTVYNGSSVDDNDNIGVPVMKEVGSEISRPVF